MTRISLFSQSALQYGKDQKQQAKELVLQKPYIQYVHLIGIQYFQRKRLYKPTFEKNKRYKVQNY